MNEQLSRSEQIELLELRFEMSKIKGVVSQLRHENRMLKHQGLMQSMVSVMNQPLMDLKFDIMAQKLDSEQNLAQKDWYRDPMVAMITPEEPPQSILNLALSLAVRVLLVLGMAIFVLAWVTK